MWEKNLFFLFWTLIIFYLHCWLLTNHARINSGASKLFLRWLLPALNQYWTTLNILTTDLIGWFFSYSNLQCLDTMCLLLARRLKLYVFSLDLHYEFKKRTMLFKEKYVLSCSKASTFYYYYYKCTDPIFFALSALAQLIWMHLGNSFVVVKPSYMTLKLFPRCITEKVSATSGHSYWWIQCLRAFASAPKLESLADWLLYICQNSVKGDSRELTWLTCLDEILWAIGPPKGNEKEKKHEEHTPFRPTDMKLWTSI